MARYVTLSITYDMDDENKTLKAELQDWIRGDVKLEDLLFDDGNGWASDIKLAIRDHVSDQIYEVCN